MEEQQTTEKDPTNTNRMVKAYERKYGPLNESATKVAQKTLIVFYEKMQEPGAAAREELPKALLEALEDAGVDFESKKTDEIIKKVRDALNLGTKKEPEKNSKKTTNSNNIRERLGKSQKLNLGERAKGGE